MRLLRLALGMGLLLHKALWEAMKPQGAQEAVASSPPPGLQKRAVKGAKVVALGFLVLQTLALDVAPISKRPGSLRVFGLAIYAFGLLVAVLGRLQLGRNWANVEDAQVLPDQQLVKDGIYRYIRHPIYAGDLLLLAGLQLALNSWLVLGALLPLGIVLKRTSAEEALLSERFAEYPQYQKRTKRLIPFVF